MLVGRGVRRRQVSRLSRAHEAGAAPWPTPAPPPAAGTAATPVNGKPRSLRDAGRTAVASRRRRARRTASASRARSAPAEKLKAQGTTARTRREAQPAQSGTGASGAAASPEVRAGRERRAGAAETPAAAGATSRALGRSADRASRRGAASSIVQRLSGKGYPAFLVNPAGSDAEPVLQGAGRPLRRSRRGRTGVAAAREGRAVPVLDFALAAALGRAPRTQLSEVRRSRLRLARADAAPGGVGAGRCRRRARIAAPSSLVSPPERCALPGTLYWLVETMTTFGDLAPPLAVVAAGLLVAYLVALSRRPSPSSSCRFVRVLRPIGLLLARRSGSRASSAASTSGTAFRGSFLATAR